MGDINDNQITTDVNYAISASSALGIRLLYIDIKGESPQIVKEGSLTHRLMRSNKPGSQSNLWLFGGIGNFHLQNLLLHQLQPIPLDFKWTMKQEEFTSLYIIDC